MKHIYILATLMVFGLTATAQFKPRPDAFPPVPDTTSAPKSVTMATTVDDMASWNRYPTYSVYLEMMQRWATQYPQICTLDTLGTSVQGRLILAVHIEGERHLEVERPQFFYSSTIHGDEVTGYVMMLRLIDTLLSSYGTSPRLTSLVNSTAIYINPLANPDGTYRRGNHTVVGATRYNANNIDLNRTFPDPFSGSSTKALQPENQAMVDYAFGHRFRLSANLHGGAEVLNYPWDSFTSTMRPHPESDWWKAVCKRFVDTCRTQNSQYMSDVTHTGYIAGGDWYIIPGGRQDYMNYVHNCLELTMEISTTKTLACELLPRYWRYLSASFINYIEEIHHLPGSVGMAQAEGTQPIATPNPASHSTHVSGLPAGLQATLYDAMGHPRATYTTTAQPLQVSLNELPSGLYLLRAGSTWVKIVKP